LNPLFDAVLEKLQQGTNAINNMFRK
jgi:hypothetical protein